MQRLLTAGITFSLIFLSACRTEDSGIGESDEGQLVIGQSEVEETTVRGVNPGTRMLVLTGFTGNIRLSGTNDQNARLEFTKRARAADDTGARRLLGDVHIDESGGDEAYTFTLRSERPERTAIDVNGTVPAGTPLRITTESGTIELSGLDGPLDIENQHGSIRVAGTGRPVSIATRNGDIELGMRLVPPDGTVSVSTSNGDITLALPAAASAQLEARTEAGGIAVTGLSFTTRRLTQTGAGARFTGQIGQGNATINLQTENGSITIQEGRIMTLPASDTLVGTPSDAIEGDTTLDETLAPADTLEEADAEAQDTSVLQEENRRESL